MGVWVGVCVGVCAYASIYVKIYEVYMYVCMNVYVSGYMHISEYVCLQGHQQIAVLRCSTWSIPTYGDK